MTSIQIIEASLVLFWAGYIVLNWWLLRSPVNEGAEDAGTAPAAVLGTLNGEGHA